MIRILKQLFLTTILLFSVLSCCFGQGDKSTKALLDSTSLNTYSKTIIIWKCDSLVVITTWERFELLFDRWLKEHPDIVEDQRLFNAILRFTADKSIDAVEAAKDLKITDRLEFIVADILENGRCLIYNDRTRQLENRIQTTEYSTVGYGGRKFIVGNTIILKTIDRIYYH